jgi:hypothetical protein
MEWNKFGEPIYALIETSTFGLRIVAGIITGIRFTEDKPVYTIQFGKDSWQSSQIAGNKEELLKLIKIPELKRIKETHGLIIKYS